MKPIMISALLISIITLTACSVKQADDRLCVSDEYTITQAPVFSLTADIPEDAVALTDTDGNLVLYEQGDYEILREVFPAESAQDGLKQLTGKTPDELNALRLSSFPHEEYRFSWVAAGEAGDVTCCGTILFDGSTCYCLTFQCPSTLENRYRNVFYHILSNVALQPI